MTAARPRPEDFLELVERAKRGRLKLYLGFAAGVGKTYRMLEEAHALKQRGVDVVVGYVEPHGRKETAALVEANRGHAPGYGADDWTSGYIVTPTLPADLKPSPRVRDFQPKTLA